MLDTEYEVIHKILETKDIPLIDKMKIGSSFFRAPETKEAFNYLKKYYYSANTYGHLPSFDLFRQHYPGFPEPSGSDNTLEVLIDDLRERHMKRQLTDIAQTVMKYEQNDPKKGYEWLKNEVLKMGSDHEINDDLTLAGSCEILKQRYEQVEKGGGTIGTPWIWPTMNQLTMGKIKGHYILWRGYRKLGKSVNAIADAVHACKNYNERILYYSLEMPNIQVNQIAACYWAGIDLGRCWKGQLNPREKKLFYDTLDWFALNNPNWLTTSGSDITDIASLQVKIREFNPDGVYLDTLFQLADSNSGRGVDVDWKVILNNSRKLKQLQKRMKNSNPVRDFYIVAIIQSRDDDSVAYSKGVEEDCDISILLRGHEIPDTKEKYLEIKIGAIRAGEQGSFFIEWKPGLSCAEIIPPQQRIGSETAYTPPQNKFASSFKFGSNR
jgi:replicative DNA helicase